MPSAVILLADGAEAIETVITADVLRRAGIDVTIAGVRGDHDVICSRKVVIKPDVAFQEAIKKDFDMVICPGGIRGSEQLASSKEVGVLLQKQEKRGSYIACISAAPLALRCHGIFKGKQVTSDRTVRKLLQESGYDYKDDSIVVDGKLITSRGLGTAFEFALELVELLSGKEKRDSLIPSMLLEL